MTEDEIEDKLIQFDKKIKSNLKAFFNPITIILLFCVFGLYGLYKLETEGTAIKVEDKVFYNGQEYKVALARGSKGRQKYIAYTGTNDTVVIWTSDKTQIEVPAREISKKSTK